MPAPREYDAEARVLAVGTHRDRLVDHESKLAPHRQVGAILDIEPATLRGRIERAAFAGERP